MGKIFYLFGELTEHTARWFAEELATIDEVVVNSNGGDVFAAISIAESLKKSSRDIVVRVQGLCASAATLLLFADKKIVASDNSLFMFHAPRVMLNADYTAAELETLKISLDKLTENLERTYAKKFREPLSLEKELWLTAAEALKLGLIDEIDGEVESRIDAKNNVLYINKLCFKMESLPEAVSMNTEKIIAETRAEELNRVRALLKLKTTDLSSAIVDVAIEQGATAAQIEPYLAALKKVTDEESLTRKRITDTSEKIIAVIKDNMSSGAQNVTGSSPAPENDSERKIKLVADFANRSN